MNYIKMSPLAGLTGYGGGSTGLSNHLDGSLKVGTITATWSGDDGYSGGQITNGDGSECHSESTFDERPPTNAQATAITGTWTTCKTSQYEESVVTDTELFNGSAVGYFFMRNNNTLVLTYSGWTGGMEMSDAVYATGSRPWTVTGGSGSSRSTTINSGTNSYQNWTMPSSGGCTMTWTTTVTGDPPYLWWSGSKLAAE